MDSINLGTISIPVIKGDTGSAGKILSTSIEMLAPGLEPSVTNEGSETEARLHFQIPYGKNIIDASIENDSIVFTFTDGTIITAPGLYEDDGVAEKLADITAKLNEFNTSYSEKTTAFNSNYETKYTSISDLSTSTTAFLNNLSETLTTNMNTTASNNITEITSITQGKKTEIVNFTAEKLEEIDTAVTNAITTIEELETDTRARITAIEDNKTQTITESTEAYPSCQAVIDYVEEYIDNLDASEVVY